MNDRELIVIFMVGCFVGAGLNAMGVVTDCRVGGEWTFTPGLPGSSTHIKCRLADKPLPEVKDGTS